MWDVINDELKNNKSRYILKVANTPQPSAEPTTTDAAARTQTRSLSTDASQPRRELTAAAAPCTHKSTTVANTPQPSAEPTASASSRKHTSKVKINKYNAWDGLYDEFLNNKNRYIFKVANTPQPSAEPTNAAAAASRIQTRSPSTDASQPRRELTAAAAAPRTQPSAETTSANATCKHTSKVKINK